MEASEQGTKVSAWKVRAVVYGFVAVLAALVLVPRALSDDGASDDRLLIGSTSQRSTMSMTLEGDGVAGFQIQHFASYCSSRKWIWITWFPSTRQGNVSYERKGRRFEVHEWHDPDFPHPPGMRVSAWLTGTLSSDGRRVEGTASYTAEGKGVSCSSGRVRFSASRGP